MENWRTGKRTGFCRILTTIRVQWDEFVLGLFRDHWMLPRKSFWVIGTEVFKTPKPRNFWGKSVEVGSLLKGLFDLLSDVLLWS